MRFAERQLRLALVVLLAGAAVLLAVGTALERHQNADQSQAATVTRASGAAAAGETGETGGEGGAEAGSAHAATATAEQHGSGERFFGVAESLPLTIVAVVVSVALALALAVWARPGRLVVWLVLVAVVMLAAADARELVHHLREARPAVATIAGVLLGMHVVAAGAAALLVVRERSAASRMLTP